MARATPKKKPSANTSGSGNILSFFNKADARATNVNETVKVEPADAGPSTVSRTAGREKGKGRAAMELGSVADPVVISDDDEPIVVASAAKRRRTSGDRPASPVQFDVDQAIFPGTEPSHSPVLSERGGRTISPPVVENRHPFPAFPAFQKPPSWPEIINTASGAEDNEDVLNLDEDGDGSVILQDSDGEDDDPGNMIVDHGNEDDAGEIMPSPIPPTKPIEQSSPLVSTSRHPLLDGEDAFDPGLVWDEPEDEGMGMEEEGDEEASEIIATPPPVTMKRKRVGTGDKVDECPVCGKSLKGKVNTDASQHINSCLDASASGSSSRKAIRPITSISHTYSPAGSPSPPPEESNKGPNAFSVLMSGHKEKEQWKDAEIDLKRDGKRHFGRRKAPFYKVMTGMPVAVDAFRYGAIPKVKAYLLTHAHSDHYTNLSKAWKEGPIYCSETTANLIVHMLGVEPQWVHGLPDNIPFEMPGTGGVKVTPIEANHCPGSSIFLFEGPQTVNAGDSSFKSPYVGSKRIFRYLHCGDFRACPKMVLHPDIARAKIDTCYLDTTYLNPKYCFPPQPQVIEACAILARKVAMGVSDQAPKLEELRPEAKVDIRFDAKPDVNAVKEELEEKERGIMRGWLVSRESGDDVKLEEGEEVRLEDGAAVKTEHSEEEKLRNVNDLMVPKPVVKAKPKARTLIVMGTYSIGKERIVKAVAKALGTKIYCDPRKRGILLCQTDPELHALLSTDPVESQVHLLPLGNIQLDALQPYLARLHPHFDRVLGFRPTGWSYSPPAGTDMLPDVNMVIRRDQSRTFGDASLKPMRGSCRQFMMYGVPYSEHSSFFELTCFALSVPGPDVKMIATVNVGNEKSRAKMKKWFEKWQAEKMKRKDKGLPAIVDYRDETYW